MKAQFGQVDWRLPDQASIDVETLASTILQRRGMSKHDQEALLHPRYSDLGDPFLLPDMEAAVDQLQKDRADDNLIVVYGDYDIDGLTASSLLGDIFTRLGMRHRLYIPDRFEEGYGLHSAAIEQLAREGVKTIVSVDCGSTALEQVALAAALGLAVIITDHHTIVAEELPGAVAHINPLREASRYPERSLAGVGVAFALARALQERFPDELIPGQEKWLLDLVALGTICDVVPLVGENRILAHFGLTVMQRTRRVGLRALAKISDVDISQIQAEHLGYRIGPRLNAAGRLEHAQRALELLTTTDPGTAQQQAEYLQSLNTQRQVLTQQVLESARQQAQLPENTEVGFLVLADEHWSHGVAGLAAARIAEEFKRPTLVLQIEGDTAKGSARTFGGISVILALRSQSDLLEKFGGHQAAAGATLRTTLIDSLRAGLSAYIAEQIQPDQWVKEEGIDAWLETSHATPAGMSQLNQLEPTGQKMPPARFVIRGEIISLRPVGKQGEHYQLRLRSEGDGTEYKMIAFGAALKFPTLQQSDSVTCVVRLTTSEWQGVSRVELTVLDILSEQGN